MYKQRIVIRVYIGCAPHLGKAKGMVKVGSSAVWIGNWIGTHPVPFFGLIAKYDSKIPGIWINGKTYNKYDSKRR